MMLINRSKKTLLAKEVIFCSSLSSKIRGLMFTKKTKKALIFDFKREKRIGLHMWFVFYPIDIIFLDSKREVVGLKENFMPFSAYISAKKARYAVELPEGAIRRSRTKHGDIIEWGRRDLNPD